MPQQYIGTKLIQAVPMNRADYNLYRGWQLPANENGADEGYLVEYLDGGQANDPRHAGYISWSPAPVFDKSYRPTQGMTFGLAIEAMKMGSRACRAGWNGKGMFIFLNPGSDPSAPESRPTHLSGIGSSLFGYGDTGTTRRLPNLNMRAADGATVTGWLASQTDMLAEDWMVV
jgi:hypothetical protein